MTNVNKNSKLIPNETAGTNTINNNQTTTTLQLKSKCGDCFCQVITESINRAKANESLSSNEKAKSLRLEIYDVSCIPINMMVNHQNYLESRLAIEERYLAQGVTEHPEQINKTVPEEQKEAVVKTIFLGKKSDFVKNAAHYFFNPKNILGLHLSHKQVNRITDMLCDNFIAEDDTPLRWRSVHEILNSGFKMDENGEILS